ncbi:hypothetical protein I4000191A8_12440 [Clostridia bacterium i40-0019-1A8]
MKHFWPKADSTPTFTIASLQSAKQAKSRKERQSVKSPFKKVFFPVVSNKILCSNANTVVAWRK